MSEWVGEAHTDMAYPGDVAEEMHAHAIENAVAPLVALLADKPIGPGETSTTDLRLIIQCGRSDYDGLAPATVSVTATVQTGAKLERPMDLARIEEAVADLIGAGASIDMIKAAVERAATRGLERRHASPTRQEI